MYVWIVISFCRFQTSCFIQILPVNSCNFPWQVCLWEYLSCNAQNASIMINQFLWIPIQEEFVVFTLVSCLPECLTIWKFVVAVSCVLWRGYPLWMTKLATWTQTNFNFHDYIMLKIFWKMFVEINIEVSVHFEWCSITEFDRIIWKRDVFFVGLSKFINKDWFDFVFKNKFWYWNINCVTNVSTTLMETEYWNDL